MLNAYKRVEAMLYNYKKTKAEINILNRQLEMLKNDYRGTGAISYDEKSSPTNKFNSSVENEVIKRAKEIEELKDRIQSKEVEINNIDDALTILTENERFIITERYFNQTRNKELAIKLNVTKDTASRYKTAIINKLIPLLTIGDK